MEQLTLLYCHQFILGRTNYWVHDAGVDNLSKAQQPEGLYSKMMYCSEAGEREVGAER